QPDPIGQDWKGDERCDYWLLGPERRAAVVLKRVRGRSRGRAEGAWTNELQASRPSGRSDRSKFDAGRKWSAACPVEHLGAYRKMLLVLAVGTGLRRLAGDPQSTTLLV
ncbi:MAG: hypothetical protein OXC11_10040, partial [Rhodospirillales bacterium]|nr:hypothetical protein [Rhodospirillales bacterium]